MLNANIPVNIQIINNGLAAWNTNPPLNGPKMLDVVPAPVPKNHGRFHESLLPSDNSNNGAGVSVQIVNIGSFTLNQVVPLEAPPSEFPEPPNPMKCRDANFVRRLTREECHEALLGWVKKDCCIAKGPAKEAHVGEAFNYNAFEYQLYTFTEKRGIVCRFSSCRPGERIDSLSNGQSPNPWSIQCLPDQHFINHVKYINIPHTNTLHPCFRCNAFGDLRCAGCNGCGEVPCSVCMGSGTNLVQNPDGSSQRLPCNFCSGKGRTRCTRCSGNGDINCDFCNGTQWLKWYLQVQVTYTNHLDEYLSEKTELPDEIIKTVQGEVLKQDEGVQILPIDDCSKEEINQNSARLIQKANQAYSNEKRVLQKHTLTCITCTQCSCTHNGQEFKFWVLGQTKEVYCPEYPGAKCCGCCCCCSIS